MHQKIRLILAGGGTGGHIIPNIAIIDELRRRYNDNCEILYIGGRASMEESIISRMGVNFRGIHCGKLRRYLSIRNFLDFFKIPLGIIEAFFIIGKFKPDVIFCKGGYVSFPVALAGNLRKVPVILHESDVMPGLANKLSSRFATKICVSFNESSKYFDTAKIVVTGNPVRKEITEGDMDKARQETGFYENMPVLIVMGGSQGASFINDVIWDNLGKFLKNYQIIHICGEGNIVDENQVLEFLKEDEKGLISRYKLFGYVSDELKNFYALSDVIISRAGAISLAEISAVGKPAILIPLSRKSSRGDQIVNANAYVKENFGFVMDELNFSTDKLFENIDSCMKNKNSIKNGASSQALHKVISVIESI